MRKTVLFIPDNKVVFINEYDIATSPIKNSGVTCDTVLTVESVVQISDVYPECDRKSFWDCPHGSECQCLQSAISVGHPQWVNVDVPGVGVTRFSGAFFKIAPGGRLNEATVNI